ncbi:WbuC family cupin fold metalloprotein [Undibacterium fentianense]|uniref:WbuC family cupin fold metalloprotein n=1 Tax=Undibacterium fentianense TaxID=2828728 RepID=A0A941E2W9_9BURK|nr:WbuC family cupin fold metalloprotein [Undibacterium fentianense]MBR7801335.1 WbuC family cupin fold metalloprotein [Undibacterium fentianense]
MTKFQILDQAMLSALSSEASGNARLRKNLNFHENNESLCHRLLNALQPGTYVQPHCHLAKNKDETLVVVAGKIGVLLFDSIGQVVQAIELAPNTAQFGVHIPVGTFHSMVALAPNSVFFESKSGPYVAISEAERSLWAPAENDVAAPSYLAQMLAHFN